MYEHEKKTGKAKVENGKIKVKTAHSLNPVPVYIYDPSGTAKLELTAQKGLGISSLAATCIKLLGFAPPSNYDPSVVDVG
jgi:2,3-bisphosphoglycerate-independent phosphoglycerate mutase